MMAVIVPTLIYELVGFLFLRKQSIAKNSVALSAINSADIVPELIFTFIMAAILYYSAHILHTLFKSNSFRARTGRSDRKNGFIMMLVFVISGVRALRFSLMIAKISLITITFRDVMASRYVNKIDELLAKGAQIDYPAGPRTNKGPLP